MSSKSRYSFRQSTTSELVSKTPQKSTRTERSAKREATKRLVESAKKPVVRKRKTSKIERNPCFNVSSSSSSDEEPEDEYKPKSSSSSSERDVSPFMEVSFDQENESLETKPNKKEELTDKCAKVLSSLNIDMNFQATPRKANLLVLRGDRSINRNRETPKSQKKVERNLRKGAKKVFDWSDGDDVFDESFNYKNTASNSRPATRNSTKNEKIKKVTPIKLTCSKTPGGTRKFITRNKNQQESIEEKEKIILKIPLRSLGTNGDKLSELACKLHLSEVPENLPCRENEAFEVRQFIEEAIDPHYGESSAMYISGVPGTGKTATVRAVVKKMKSEKKLPNFVYVEVNAMIFRKKVFVEIYNGINEKFSINAASKTKSVAATTARQRLNTIFRKKDARRPPIIILVDELDGLCTRKQDVLYDIFDWTSLPDAKVSIIAIANTLDFPERMLCQRIASRLDKRRLIFQPYEHKQISEIINNRIKGSNLVEKNAVELVSRKVASISGDLRQALDFLRRAIRIAITKNDSKLSIDHITLAQKAASEPFRHRLVSGLRLHQFNLFRSVLTVMQQQKEETIFAEVYKTYSLFCQTLSGVSPVSDGEAYEMLFQLSRCSLILLSGGQCGMLQRKVRLGMGVSEAEKCIVFAEEMRKSINS